MLNNRISSTVSRVGMCLYMVLLGNKLLLSARRQRSQGPDPLLGFLWRAPQSACSTQQGAQRRTGTQGRGIRDFSSRPELQPRHCVKPCSLPQLTALKPSSNIFIVFCIYFLYYFLKGAGGYLSGSNPGPAKSRRV